MRRAILLLGALVTTFITCAQTPVLMQDIAPGTQSSSVVPLLATAWNGKLYFTSGDSSSNIGVANTELWRYDEKSAAKRVYDLYPGSGAGIWTPPPGNFCSFKGKLYMGGNNGSSGYELVAYDGVNPPAVVADINPGNTSSYPHSFAATQNMLFFAATQDSGSFSSNKYIELYRYDGSHPPVLTRLNNGANLTGSNPQYFTLLGGDMYFAARPGATDFVLMRCDASGSIAPAPGCGAMINPGAAVQTGGKLYFSAYSPGYGRELWNYDGTLATRLTDLAPGTKTGLLCDTYAPVLYGNSLYFPGSTDSVNFSLYAYNLSSGQTTQVNPVKLGDWTEPGPSGSMIVYNNALYFVAYTAAAGYELWKYDSNSCALYADIYAGPKSGFYTYISSPAVRRMYPAFTEYNGHLYFHATDSLHGTEMWRIGNLAAAGIQEASWGGCVTVYPNPAAGPVILELTLVSAQRLSVSLTDAAGRLIYTMTQPFQEGKSSVRIPVQHYAAGRYYYHVNDGGGRLLAGGSIIKP